jgi:hypothetical protein
MNYQVYSHRYADIILNSDYEIKKEIEEIIKKISYKDIVSEFGIQNSERGTVGKKEIQGKQTIINFLFKKEFDAKSWESEKMFLQIVNKI